MPVATEEGQQVTQSGSPDYQVGNVLRVSCAPAPARVTETSSSYVSIEWPWGEADPDSQYGWNGRFALPVDRLGVDGSSEEEGDTIELDSAAPVAIERVPQD
jgi:hypothetical protein